MSVSASEQSVNEFDDSQVNEELSEASGSHKVPSLEDSEALSSSGAGSEDASAAEAEYKPKKYRSTYHEVRDDDSVATSGSRVSIRSKVLSERSRSATKTKSTSRSKKDKYRTVDDLMLRYAKSSSKDWNFMVNGSHRSKWSVDGNNLADFWLGYCDLTWRSKSDENAIFELSERTGNSVPVVLDFIFTVSGTTKKLAREPPPNEDAVTILINIIQRCINEVFTVQYISLLDCVLIRGETIQRTEEGMRSQIRLHFPQCCTEKLNIRDKLLPCILNALSRDSDFKKAESHCDTNWAEIMSCPTLEETFNLYMSQTPDGLPVKMMFDGVFSTSDDLEEVNKVELDSVLKVEDARVFNYGLDLAYTSKGSMFWMPQFLSVTNPQTILRPKTRKNKPKKRDHIVDPNQDAPESRVLCDKFLPMLAKTRTKTPYWENVGKAIFTIYNGTEEGLRKFQEWTRTGNKHKEQKCEKFYTGILDDSRYDHRTLAWYAKEDNPAKYKEWHDRYWRHFIENSEMFLDKQLGETIYRRFWLEYVCVGDGKDSWYKYKNNRWFKMRGTFLLQKDIFDKFDRDLISYSMEVENSMLEKYDQLAHKNSLEVRLNRVKKTRENLSKATFRKYNSFYENFFYDENFGRFLDQNPNLVATKTQAMHHGVLETVLKKSRNKETKYKGDIYYRPGIPQDYISKSLGTYYDENMTEDDSRVKKVKKFFRKVYVDKELRNSELTFWASRLKGRNTEKIVKIHTGVGNNGKSVLAKFIETVFGDYCKSLDPAEITSKYGNAAGPSPQLARLEGAHIVIVKEISGDVTMDGGRLRKLSGGDRFYARLLHENGDEKELFFSLIMQMNRIPAIPGAQKAERVRLQCAIHETEFIDPNGSEKDRIPETIEEQYRQKIFPQDQTLENDIPKLAPGLLWWLKNKFFKRYVKCGLTIPKVVADYTKHYWETTDPYSLFISEVLEYKYTPKGKKDKTQTALVLSLWRLFRRWYADSFPQTKSPNKGSFISSMDVILGERVNEEWIGIALNQDAEALYGGDGKN